MNNRKRAMGFYIGLVSVVIALIAGVALLIFGKIVDDFYALPSILLIVGAVIALVGLLKDISFLAIFPGICYMSALGMYLKSQITNISGQLSDTGFGATGTSLEMLIMFCALMLLATLLALVASFMRQYKEIA